MQLDLASGHVNFCAEARRKAIRRLLENGLGAIHLHLGRIDARGFGKHLQIRLRDDVDHDFPRIRRGKLGRSLRFASGLVGADRLHIGDALRQVASQIEIVERAHDARKMDPQTRRKLKFETIGGQIDLFHVLANAAGQIREQHAPRNDVLPYGALRGLLRGNPPEVIAKPHFQRRVERKRERLIGGRPRARAALIGAGLRRGINHRGKYADDQKEETKTGNSHGNRSILQD